MTEREWLVREDVGVKSGRIKGEEARHRDSPEGPAVLLVELCLVVGEEEEEVVWLMGGGDVRVVGFSGRLGGYESGSVTSSSNGSG